MCRSVVVTRPFVWYLFIASLFCLTGCAESGRGGLEVCGSVELDGQPMSSGSIVFVPLASGHKAAGEIASGAFHIAASDGPIPGSYRIEVYAPELSSVPWDDPLAFARSAPGIPPSNAIAAQFNTQSMLTADVTADGDNQFSFEVQTAKR